MHYQPFWKDGFPISVILRKKRRVQLHHKDAQPRTFRFIDLDDTFRNQVSNKKQGAPATYLLHGSVMFRCYFILLVIFVFFSFCLFTLFVVS